MWILLYGCVFLWGSLCPPRLSRRPYLSLLLIYFSADLKSRSDRDKEPTTASELFGCFQSGWIKKKGKKSVFRINPVSSWTLRTEWQTDGAKKCEQCQWAQCWFKWAIQGGRRQLKLKVWALFTVWSGTIHSFVLFYKNDWGLLHNEINWFSIWYRQVIHILWFWMVRKLWNLYFRAAKHFEEDWRTRERTKM